MLDNTHRNKWFAVQVKTRYEKNVARLLRSKGYEEFLPTYQRKKPNGRILPGELPLFPGYLFCRFDPENRAPLVTTPGIIRIVGVGREPIPVDEDEILAIEKVVSSGFHKEPWPMPTEGSCIRVERGPLAGLAGIFIGSKKVGRFIVSVGLLQRSVAVELDSDSIGPVDSGLSFQPDASSKQISMHS